jgi:hypothetical protein
MITQNWAEEELQSIDLGDQRLNKRLIQLTESFSQSPQSPINHACEDWAETKGAYRFFSNENVDYKDILQGHIKSTTKRCLEYPTILASQDTTYFNYTSHPKTEGLSILTTKKGFNKSQRRLTKGLIMHSSLAVSTDGLPLGVLDQKTYCHEERHVERKIRKAQNDLLPIEEKESFRWLESLQNTNAALLDEKIAVVTVCDREADIYDFFLLSYKIQSPVLVRAKSNRIINKKTTYSKKTGEKLWSFMQKQSCQGSIQVEIPKNEKIPSRLATLEIRFCTFTLNPPFNHPKLKKRKTSNTEAECCLCQGDTKFR